MRVDVATGALTQILNETPHPIAGVLSTPFFDQPQGLAFDSQGCLLVGGERLVRVSPGADGIVNGSADETFEWIGGLIDLSTPSSLPPFLGDGLHPTLAVLSMYQMFVAADGAVVFGDGTHVRRIDPGSDGIVNGSSDERIWSLAGYFAPSFLGGRSFGTERYGSYRGVAEDPVHGGVIVADNFHQILSFGYAPASPPSVSIRKSIVDPSGQEVTSYNAQNGETLTFVLAVANQPGAAVGPTTGPITVTDVLDPLLTFDPSGDVRCLASGQTVTCVDTPALAPGFAMSFIVKARVSATAAGVGRSTQVSNRATVATAGDASASDNVSQPVVVTVNGPRPPFVEISKTIVTDVSAGVHNGDVVAYSIGISNDSQATNNYGPTTGPVIVGDTLDSRLSFVPASSDSRCAANGQAITCTRSAQTPLAPGGGDSFRLTVRVSPTAAGLDQTVQIANQAIVTTPDDANPNHASSSVVVAVIGPKSPYIEIDKETVDPNAERTGVSAGAIVGYLVNVLNDDTYGPTTGPLIVTDTLDQRLTFVPARSDSRCVAAGQVVTCTRTAALQPGSADSFTIAVQVAANAAAPNQTVTIDNRATVSTSNNANPFTTSRTSSVPVTGLTNHPPTVNAGTYAPIAATSVAGAIVTLAGTASDPDPGDTLSLKWTEGGALLGTSATIATVLTIGTHTVTLTATDSHGASTSASATVSVIVGTPQIRVRLAGSGSLGGGLRFVNLEISNVGSGLARNVTATVLPRTILGSGQPQVVSGGIAVGSVAPGQAVVVRVLLNVPPTVHGFLLVEVGTVANLANAVTIFAGIQVIVP